MSIVVTNRARVNEWRERWRRARTRLVSASVHARRITQLMREPHAIDAAAAADLVQTVNLVVEARCNIRCSCCHYFATREHESLEQPIDLPRMLAMVEEVPRALVGITGGEPLLAPARVVEAARHLLLRNRDVALVTNSLPLAHPRGGAAVRDLLVSGLDRSARARIRVQCSVDTQHLMASRLSLEEYVARCHAAIRFLTASGFPVFTRSIVTTGDEYRFYRTYVQPLAQEGIVLGTTVQPDIYSLPAFVDALERHDLGDIGSRLGHHYLKRILAHAAPSRGKVALPSEGDLPAAPWVFIEVSAAGVKGPSGFVSYGAHHSSVVDMLRSYDWLAVADSIVPQITLCQNASWYRINRETRTASLNLRYVMEQLLRLRPGRR